MNVIQIDFVNRRRYLPPPGPVSRAIDFLMFWALQGWMLLMRAFHAVIG